MLGCHVGKSHAGDSAMYEIENFLRQAYPNRSTNQQQSNRFSYENAYFFKYMYIRVNVANYNILPSFLVGSTAKKVLQDG